MSNQSKMQLFTWFQKKLSERNIKIQSLQQLSTGNHFIELIYLYHPKAVDLTKIYIKPKSKYDTLQNYKQLLSIFMKLGWKKFDPQKYANQKQKDYTSLAKYLMKTFTSTYKQQQFNQLQVDQDDQSCTNMLKGLRDQSRLINESSKIKQLQQTKKKLLDQIMTIQNIVSNAKSVKDAQKAILNVIGQL